MESQELTVNEEVERPSESIKGTPGFEPGTYRSAVDCSTTELYPRTM